MTLLRILTVFNRVALRQIERGDHVVSKVTDTLKTKIKQGTSKSATTTEKPQYDKLVGRINKLRSYTEGNFIRTTERNKKIFKLIQQRI